MCDVQFSVIIPLYNKGGEIRRAIDSLGRQICKSFEILIIDDGSTDGGDLVAQDALAGVVCDGRREFVRKANGGVATARNLGFSISRGKYLVFLDADDEFQRYHLSDIYMAIQKFPEVGVYSTLTKVVTDRFESFDLENYSTPVVDVFRRPLYRFCVDRSLVNSSNICIDRALFGNDAPFAVGVHRGEDLLVWLPLLWQRGLVQVRRIGVLIYRNASNRSADIVVDSVPPYFHWLLERLHSGSLSRTLDVWLFFLVSGLATGLNAAYIRDSRLLRELSRLAFQCHATVLGLIMLLASFVPRSALRLCMKRR
jgi:glycosyltransferase involved in cell wall biosynthesis